MSNTLVKIKLEMQSGLTETAIEQQIEDEYGDELEEVEVMKV